jgi:hypothetical protein
MDTDAIELLVAFLTRQPSRSQQVILECAPRDFASSVARQPTGRGIPGATGAGSFIGRIDG